MRDFSHPVFKLYAQKPRAAPIVYRSRPVTLEMTVHVEFQSLVSSPKSSQKQMKPKDAQKKRADIRLLICSVTICTIFMLLFLPSVLINVIKVT